MTNTTNTVAASGAAILFEHEDGRYAVNPNTTGDPAWHRLGPVDVSAIAAAPAQAVAILFEHEDGRYAINPDTTGDPAWHRLGPVDVSAIAAEPAQPVAQEGGTIVKLIEKKIAGMSPSEASAFIPARAALAASGNDQAAPDMRDPYGGAREDLAIWRKRALEAEALNRKFATSVNGPTFMGEPADSDSALMAREIHESQEDTLLICASDLQHSAIYDNHVEMQSCMRAVAARIAALVHAAPKAEPAAPAPARCKSCGTHEVSQQQTCHNSGCAVYAQDVTIYEGWKSHTPASSQPFAYEFSRSNGDGTHSEHIERGRLQEVAPGRWEHSGLPRGALADKPIKALYTTPQTQPAAVLASGPVAWLHDCAALLTNDVELWIDACPHCGKPRNAPQPVERQPLTDEQIEALPAWSHFVGLWPESRKEIVRAIEAAHGIAAQQGDAA